MPAINAFTEYSRSDLGSPAQDIAPITAGAGELTDPADGVTYVARTLLCDVACAVTILTVDGKTRTNVPLVAGWNPIGALRVTAISGGANVWGVKK